MFELPRYVIKAGEMLIDQGELREPAKGKTLHVAPAYDAGIETDLARHFERYYSVRLANYPPGGPRNRAGRSHGLPLSSSEAALFGRSFAERWRHVKLKPPEITPSPAVAAPCVLSFRCSLLSRLLVARAETLTGVVLAEDGQPASDAAIAVAAVFQSPPLRLAAETNDQGAFRIDLPKVADPTRTLAIRCATGGRSA